MRLTNQACGSWRLRRRRERQLIHRFCSRLLFLDPIVCTYSFLPSPRVAMFLPMENRSGPIGASNVALFYRAIPIPSFRPFCFPQLRRRGPPTSTFRSRVFNFDPGVTRSREVRCARGYTALPGLKSRSLAILRYYADFESAHYFFPTQFRYVVNNILLFLKSQKLEPIVLG